MDFKERLSAFFGKVIALSKARKVAAAVRNHYHKVWLDRCQVVKQELSWENRLDINEWISNNDIILNDLNNDCDSIWNEEAAIEDYLTHLPPNPNELT